MWLKSAEYRNVSTKPPQPAKPASNSASSPAQPSSDPKPGSKTVIDGKPHVWIPGFGWIEDHGGGTRVGNPDDELTGHKVCIMGGDEPHAKKVTPPQAELPEPEGEVIYIQFVEVPEKKSTPPDYKPNTTPPGQ